MPASNDDLTTIITVTADVPKSIYDTDLGSDIANDLKEIKDLEIQTTLALANVYNAALMNFMGKFKNPSNRTRNSVVISGGGNSKTIKITALSDEGFPYPVVANFGRGPVTAKNRKYLRFYIGGEVFFRKSVAGFGGYHFVEDSRDVLESAIDDAVGLELDKILGG
ncbi:MAG: hypothetical protein IKF11_05860 [Methanobrevibacter sp.]|nr:hypothetical protein [Methanobrevibacter sp.]